MGSTKASSPRGVRAVADGLHSSALRLLRRLRATDRETGVGPARLSALSVLVMAGPRTLKELARIEDVRPPTMTRVVQGLEAEGLATRRGDREDARVVWVRATQKGRRLLQRGRDRRVDSLEALLQGLSARELATLRDASAILRRVLAESNQGA